MENNLGEYAIYYVVATNSWSQNSNHEKTIINKFLDNYKVIDGFRCIEAIVNGSSPFRVFIPIIK